MVKNIEFLDHGMVLFCVTPPPDPPFSRYKKMCFSFIKRGAPKVIASRGFFLKFKIDGF